MGTKASVQGSSRTNVKKNGEPREPDEEDVSDDSLYHHIINSFVYELLTKKYDKIFKQSKYNDIVTLLFFYSVFYVPRMYRVINKVLFKTD